MNFKLSPVQNNLLTRVGYAPYCGNVCCIALKRTVFNGDQFTCVSCDWVSNHSIAFLNKYCAKKGLRNYMSDTHPRVGSYVTRLPLVKDEDGSFDLVCDAMVEVFIITWCEKGLVGLSHPTKPYITFTVNLSEMFNYFIV